MELTVMGVIVAITILLALVSKIWIYYAQKQKQTSQSVVTASERISLNADYAQYQVVARRASVPNTPVRVSGDFLDFISSSSSSPRSIETRLSQANCGEVLN